MKEPHSELLKSGTHCGFCDESKYNVGRYRAVSMVSMRASFFPEFDNSLENILNESDIAELKWYALTSAKMRFAAIKALDYTLDSAEAGKIRVDTLIWDTEDTRHKILKRDDLLNLQIMYYHLFLNVIIKKWDEPGVWIIFPDEQSATNWTELGDILEKGIRKEERQIIAKDPDFILFKGLIGISQIRSHECTAVQVADLFAGLGIHSHESIRKHISFYVFKKWRKCRRIPDRLKKQAKSILRSFSRSDRERCRTLLHFHTQCRKKRWGVHLLRTHGLKTTMRECPINFWFYMPQSPKDKAPVKTR